MGDDLERVRPAHREQAADVFAAVVRGILASVDGVRARAMPAVTAALLSLQGDLVAKSAAINLPE
jgi:hypothetical protein